ncbi:uncharacterized protein LOC135203085 [Macrobrachium nipponense]|uniref:uncharacterized protein LOC135203085 n=1 Tax=Macrobrachium nipponense TaxID=159736 RepID=UPI0030C7B5FE
MEVDQHLVWLLSAINACVSDGNVDEKKLNKNISDCLARVKSASSGSDKDQAFENFKIKAALVFLLCCPSVRDIKEVQSSKDFHSVLLTFPALQDSIFFSVVRNQKFYKYVDPLLCFLPLSTLCKLIQEYFKCTNEVTPITLAIAMELMKALVSSWQNVPGEKDEESENSAVFTSILQFFSLKKVVGGTSAQVRSSAYFFMYLCECTFLVVSTISGKYNKPQELSSIPEAWAKLWKSEGCTGGSVCDKGPISMDVLKSFCDLCNESIQGISVDVWIDWNEVLLPLSVTVHRKSVASKMKQEQSTIQSVICNIAFDMLRIVESCSEVKELLHSYKDLNQFFQQVAADPDYDPDYDLPVEKLLPEIELKDARHEKLLGILMKKDDILVSEECIDCAMMHIKKVDTITKLQVLTRLIKHLKDKKAYSENSVKMVLKMVEDLPASQLLPIIEEHLSSGQDEILKTPEFRLQMTSVFNQLVDGENSTKHVWLCLQSGQSVVSEAVKMPVAFPGLVNVMVKALASIPTVCQAAGNSGASVLINILQERLMAGLEGREEKDFGELVKGLVAASVLSAAEVLHFLVQPYLTVSSKDLKRLELPLELLKNIIHLNVEAVVKPGIETVTLMVVLAHIINATAYLDCQNSQDYLTIRVCALDIIQSLSQIMINDQERYERDISMLKQTIVRYKFHPRSFLAFMELLDCNDQVKGHADCLLFMISKLRPYWEGNTLKISVARDIPENLRRASKEELIMALIQVLPHCSEEEWIIAFYITHNYLQSGRKALPAMLIFQKVLYLIDLQVKTLKDSEGTVTTENVSQGSVSLDHCFRCFSNAAVVYLGELMEEVTYFIRFSTLCSIFKWWCQVCRSYSEELEVASLFLMQLVIAIEEMINGNKLQVVDGKNEAVHTNRGKIEKSLSLANGDVGEPEEVNGVLNSDEKSNEVDTLRIGQLKLVGGNKNKLDGRNHNTQLYNGSDGTEEKTKLCVDKKKTLLNNTITRADFKKQIEDISVAFLKFVPASKLSSSVASKLKKLHEIS